MELSFLAMVAATYSACTLVPSFMTILMSIFITILALI